MQVTDPHGLALDGEAARARLQARLADLAAELTGEEHARCLALVADPARDVESVRDGVSTRLMESFRTRSGRATFGLLYELKLNKRNPMKARSVKVRPMLGSLSHEGIEIDARGNVYVIDEDRRGSIYRFVPTRRGDLSAGQLQVLKVDAGKTGTAQVFSLKGAEYKASRVKKELRDHALFIAFAPADEPKIALAVLVENGGFGAQSAAPIARMVFDYYLLGKLPKGAAGEDDVEED